MSGPKRCRHDGPCNCGDEDWLFPAPGDVIRLTAAELVSVDQERNEDREDFADEWAREELLERERERDGRGW